MATFFLFSFVQKRLEIPSQKGIKRRKVSTFFLLFFPAKRAWNRTTPSFILDSSFARLVKNMGVHRISHDNSSKRLKVFFGTSCRLVHRLGTSKLFLCVFGWWRDRNDNEPCVTSSLELNQDADMFSLMGGATRSFSTSFATLLAPLLHQLLTHTPFSCWQRGASWSPTPSQQSTTSLLDGLVLLGWFEHQLCQHSPSSFGTSHELPVFFRWRSCMSPGRRHFRSPAGSRPLHLPCHHCRQL